MKLRARRWATPTACSIQGAKRARSGNGNVRSGRLFYRHPCQLQPASTTGWMKRRPGPACPAPSAARGMGREGEGDGGLGGGVALAGCIACLIGSPNVYQCVARCVGQRASVRQPSKRCPACCRLPCWRLPPVCGGVKSTRALLTLAWAGRITEAFQPSATHVSMSQSTLSETACLPGRVAPLAQRSHHPEMPVDPFQAPPGPGAWRRTGPTCPNHRCTPALGMALNFCALARVGAELLSSHSMSRPTPPPRHC